MTRVALCHERLACVVVPSPLTVNFFSTFSFLYHLKHYSLDLLLSTSPVIDPNNNILESSFFRPFKGLSEQQPPPYLFAQYISLIRHQPPSAPSDPFHPSVLMATPTMSVMRGMPLCSLSKSLLRTPIRPLPRSIAKPIAKPIANQRYFSSAPKMSVDYNSITWTPDKPEKIYSEYSLPVGFMPS